MKKFYPIKTILFFLIFSTISYAWTYTANHSNNDIIFSFTSQPHVRQIKQHTSPSYAPYRIIKVSKGDKVIVTKGQWLEVYRNNSWVLLSDADNR